MPTLQKYRLPIAVAIIIIVIGGLAYYLTRQPHATKPAPALTTFQSGDFMFAYSPLYDAKEYAPGVVSVGGTYGSGKIFIPLIDIVSYKTDPDEAVPASFDAFAKHEAEALCGSDDSVESISCTNPVMTPYKNSVGLAGEELSLSLVRKNLSTGTTTTSTYAPVYVFNATSPSAPASYQAVFVYASFSSFLITGTTSPNLVQAVADTVSVKGR